MSSPFIARLGSNYCPTDEEVLEIQDLLVVPTLRLEHLNREIAKLVDERNNLGTYVAAYKALISPARRLPLDILQEIFIACLPTHRNCVMSSSEAPVLLGRICSAWRAISLSTPRLWASLHVAEPTFQSGLTDEALFQHKVAQRIEMTKIWLGRSGSCPLSISLHSAPQYVRLPDIASNSEQFIEALVLFASRWQQLNFTIPLSTVVETMSRLQVDASSLETFTIYPHFHQSFSTDAWGSFGILRGPRIRSFSIPGSMFMPDKLPLRWNHLTTLSMGEYPWGVVDGLAGDALLRVISCCPELRCCELIVGELGPTLVSNPTPRHPVVELPFLHTLKMQCNRIGFPAALFVLERLSMPELHHFKLRGNSNGRTTRQIPVLTNFVMRSTCLESLDLDCTLLSKSALLECLRALPPAIRQLKVRAIGTSPWEISLDDDALAALTPSLTGTVACPGLHHLSIEHSSHVTDAAVLRLITTRMVQSRTLTRVDCQFERPRTLDILPSLKPFIATGLEVSLRYFEPPSNQFSPWHGLPDAPQPPDWVLAALIPRAE
ncbi:hypothetical protein DFH06DRAFT_1385592 [Mycena polygramma]|nr:hypothetical protein DFH06DRAFT_1385592 [Mycena polygramma]